MRRSAALLLLVLFLPPPPAQADETRGLAGYGPQVGFGLSNVCGPDSESRPKLGLVLGGFGLYRVNPRLALQAEVRYVQKGSRSAGDFFPDYREKFALDYLEFGALARLSLGPRPGRYHAVIGPALAFRLCGSFRAEWDGGSYRSDDLSDYRAVDLGLALGAGMTRPLGPGRLTLDLRATFGLLDIFLEGLSPFANQTLHILVGYLFGAR